MYTSVTSAESTKGWYKMEIYSNLCLVQNRHSVYFGRFAIATASGDGAIKRFFSYAHSKSSNESEFLYYRGEKNYLNPVLIIY
jgi:hypothetical protein